MSETSHVTIVCLNCVNFVKEMHTFRQNCIKNNCLLVGYIKLLSSFGGAAGNARVKLLDFPVENSNTSQENDAVESEHWNSVVHRVSMGNEHWNSVDNDVETNEMDCKIELNDDFAEKYYKERPAEIPTDPLEIRCNENEIKTEDAGYMIELDGFKDDCKQTETANDECVSVYCDSLQLHCDEGAINGVEDVEIELNDDFKEKYDYKQDNYDQTLGGVEDNGQAEESTGFFVSRDRRNEMNDEIKCNVCGKSFKCEFNLNRHSLLHDDNRSKYQCETCGKSYSTLYNLKYHEAIHTAGKQHKCETCGQSYSTKGDLQRHRSIHKENRRKYSCSTCGKSYYNPYTLKYHKTLHTNGKQHKCDICARSFDYKFNLKQHVLTHDKARSKYTCETCGKSYATLYTLKYHEAIHTDEKRHECETCGKCFSSRKNLNGHRAVHRETKPYQCDHCGRSFVHSHSFKRHVSIHTGEKPHKCDLCGRSYCFKSYLERHRLVHTENV